MSFFQAKSYFGHIFKATNAHGVHSPFVYELLTEVLDKKKFYSFEAIEALREKLKQDSEIIEVTDYGMGSKNLSNRRSRSIRDITNASLKAPKYAQILFRLALWTKARNIVEIGTCLGLTTAYLASAKKDSSIVTFEGCPALSAKAQQHFDQLNLANIEVEMGEFSKSLRPRLAQINSIDLGFIDGNHSYEATKEYFELLVNKCTERSVLVIDDIYWSKGMNQAWKEIMDDNRVSVSVDLFEMGIVFFRDGIEKQNFRLKV